MDWVHLNAFDILQLLSFSSNYLGLVTLVLNVHLT